MTSTNILTKQNLKTSRIKVTASFEITKTYSSYFDDVEFEIDVQDKEDKNEIEGILEKLILKDNSYTEDLDCQDTDISICDIKIGRELEYIDCRECIKCDLIKNICDNCLKRKRGLCINFKGQK